MKYPINIIWSDKDEGFVATVPEFNNLSAFGETYEEALEEARIAIEEYLAIMEEEGIPKPQPHTLSSYSGQISLRMPKTLHKDLVISARQNGVSLNQQIVNLLIEKLTLFELKKLIDEKQWENHIHLTYDRQPERFYRSQVRGLSSADTFQNSGGEI